MFRELPAKTAIGRTLGPIPYYFTRPYRLIRDYSRPDFRPDLVAGITVAVILLPQAIAFALIAELPPAMGLYTAVIAAIFGALWGSSNQGHTGPTNAISLLVLSVLLSNFTPGTAEFIVAAGMLAVMAGIFQLAMGLARLGLLVNFVSHSVIVGFATGAGFIIAIRQIPSLLGIEASGHNLAETIIGIFSDLSTVETHTAIIGMSTIAIILVLRRIKKNLPAALIAMAVASFLVWALDLDVVVIQDLPESLPKLAELPLLDLSFITRLSTGALAIGAIGLVETVAISRSIATSTGQRLDSNQEFVGQGLANIASGLFGGYPSAGSFSRSAVNFNAGAKSPISAVFSAGFVLVAMLLLAPLAAYLPRAALSGVLIVVGLGMINREEISRIWQGTRGDAIIMLVTFLGTLFLDIAFAVLAGILLSFAHFLLRTSMPRVHEVLPDSDFKHFSYQPEQESCPQLGVIDILGDLYFGAVNHVEEAIHNHLDKHPEQRFLLIRMHNVNHCDFSGIHMLESVVRLVREKAGDIYMVRVGYRVDKFMHSTGFSDTMGADNFLLEEEAIGYLFHRVLDPAICIYECPVRAFKECQNLPKQLYDQEFATPDEDYVPESVEEISAEVLWERIREDSDSLTVIDVREPREYQRGHIPVAELVPLPRILSGEYQIHGDVGREVVFVCRSGRRSKRAVQKIPSGKARIRILKGGMLAWESADLLEAIE